MATDLQVAGVTVKKQSPLAVIGLTLITIGIYFFFWVHRINREMRDIGAVYNDVELSSVKPGLSVVAQFVPIVNFIAIHRIGTRVQRVQTLTGRGSDYSMGIHWLLVLFTGLYFCYAQHALNTTYDWFHRGTHHVSPQLPGGQMLPPAAAVAAAPSGPQVPGGPFVN